MAHLLLMYQFLRAKREVNELTAKSFKFSAKKDRIKKNIEKTQKYYTDMKARISSQAKLMASQANSLFQNNFLGSAGAMSLYLDPTGAGRANGFVTNLIGNWFAEKNGEINDLGPEGEKVGIDQNQYQALLEAQMSGIQLSADADGKYAKLAEKTGISTEKLPDAIKAFTYLQQAGQQAYYSQQQMCNQYMTNFQQNVSVWEQAMNAQLEAEQDAALEPLNYEETMMELEETSVKTRLEEKKQELDNIKQELSQRVKDDAVSFGLA